MTATLIEAIGRPLKLPEVAVALDCSDGTLRRWIRQGRLKTLKVPGGVRVPPEELERLLGLQRASRES